MRRELKFDTAARMIDNAGGVVHFFWLLTHAGLTGRRKAERTHCLKLFDHAIRTTEISDIMSYYPKDWARIKQ